MDLSERADASLTPDAVRRARAPLERASTLPSAAFTSPSTFGGELSRIFSREWLCAGRVDQVPNRGDYVSLDLLGDRLMIVRGDDGTVRVLSRICRHRAAELVEGSGNTRSFQCPYHAWTFRLDGALLGTPLMDGAEAFDKDACGLPEVRSEVWAGWIFVNFDADASPLTDQLASLDAALAHYDMADMVAVETATYDSPFNWKILVDNFMEAYHHVATHRDTLQPMLPAAASHTPDNQGPYALLFMPDTDGNDPARTPAGGLTAAVVFPCHLFAPSADSLTWYQLLPDAHDHFTLRIFSCFPKRVLDDPDRRNAIEGLQAFTRTIHEQDIGACEAVWRGLQARSFDQGRLAPLEKPIWQFNQWWLDRMA